MSGSSISWAICKSAPCSRLTTTPATHHSLFFTGWMPFLPPNQQRQSTHTRLTALCPQILGCAGTRKVKPIWILQKQETVSGSSISWARCKSAPCSRLTTTPATHHSFFTGWMPFLPLNQQRQSTEGNRLTFPDCQAHSRSIWPVNGTDVQMPDICIDPDLQCQ